MNVISGHVSDRACSNPSHARLKRFPFGVSQCTLFFGKSFVWSQLKYGITANINSVFLPLYLILRLGVILFTSKPKVAASSKMVFTTIHDPEEEETQHAPSKAAEADEDEIHYLSDNPSFDVVLARSHVNGACTLQLPYAAIRLLPRATVPVVLRHGGKTWTVSYVGDTDRPRFDCQWKTFIIDNDLRCGDACVFELMESSSTNVTLKVHILRGDLPPELRELVDSRGATTNAPADID